MTAMTDPSNAESIVTDRLLVTYRAAYKLLEETIGAEALAIELDYYKSNTLDTMPGIFRHMIDSLKNKAGHKNFIADSSAMQPIFGDFDPYKVNFNYGLDAVALFKDFEQEFGERYKFDINNKRNAWMMYSKGVLSSARFLSSFKDYREFNKFVESFFLNEYTIAALPMLLEKEIFGYGFPLACDFLKEIGYQKYGKPDVHLKDVFIGLNLVPNETDYETFKAIVRTAELADTEPVIVDKVYWILGSGALERKTNTRIKRLKNSFIATMRQEFDEEDALLQAGATK